MRTPPSPDWRSIFIATIHSTISIPGFFYFQTWVAFTSPSCLWAPVAPSCSWSRRAAVIHSPWMSPAASQVVIRNQPRYRALPPWMRLDHGGTLHHQLQTSELCSSSGFFLACGFFRKPFVSGLYDVLFAAKSSIGALEKIHLDSTVGFNLDPFRFISAIRLEKKRTVPSTLVCVVSQGLPQTQPT